MAQVKVPRSQVRGLVLGVEDGQGIRLIGGETSIDVFFVRGKSSAHGKLIVNAPKYVTVGRIVIEEPTR
jgi:sRNA-binding carbon storage regulator CsrA